MAKTKEDLLSVLLDLQKHIGEKDLVTALNACGWLSLSFAPASYFQGYFAAMDWKQEPERLETIYNDVKNVANLYGFDIDGYNLIDIVPR